MKKDWAGDLRSRKLGDKTNNNRNVIINRLVKKEPYEFQPPKDKDAYDIHEYAESVGPQGLQIVINKHAPATRKAIWFLVMFGKANYTLALEGKHKNWRKKSAVGTYLSVYETQ